MNEIPLMDDLGLMGRWTDVTGGQISETLLIPPEMDSLVIMKSFSG